MVRVCQHTLKIVVHHSWLFLFVLLLRFVVYRWLYLVQRFHGPEFVQIFQCMAYRMFLGVGFYHLGILFFCLCLFGSWIFVLCSFCCGMLCWYIWWILCYGYYIGPISLLVVDGDAVILFHVVPDQVIIAVVILYIVAVEILVFCVFFNHFCWKFIYFVIMRILVDVNAFYFIISFFVN